MAGEPSERAAKKGNSAVLAFVWEQLGVGKAARIIDGDVQMLPTHAAIAALAGAVARDAMANPADAAKLLGIDVDQLPGRRAFVADDGRPGIEGRETAETAPAQHDAHSRDRASQPPCDRRTGQALAAQCLDLGLHFGRRPGGTVMRTRGTLHQPGFAMSRVTVPPLAHRPGADALRRGNGCDGPPARETLHHQHSTIPRRAGILMDVHPGLRLKGCVCGNHSLPAQPRRDNLHSNDI